jgi:hypothetical protein
MNEISSAVAFWILDAWRQLEAQLQVNAIRGISSQGSPAVVWRTSPNELKISLVALAARGQKIEWNLDLHDCKFSFGTAADSTLYPEFSEGKWVSFLLAEWVGDKRLIFAQRFLTKFDNGVAPP